MKKLIALFTFLVSAVFLYGQAREGTAKVQKSEQTAAVLELPYSPDIVNDALQDYLQKKGKKKAGNVKGFTNYRNVQASAADNSPLEMFLKVDRKSREEKDVSVISLLLSRPGDVLPAANGQTSITMEQAKQFLDSIVPSVESFNVEYQVKEQTDALTKAEKQYKRLTDEASDLEKRRLNIEREIAENKTAQQNQLIEIEKQKLKQSELINQRKQ